MFSTGLDLEREGPGGGGKEGAASTSLGPDPLYVYSTAPAHTLGPAAPTQVRIYGGYVGLGQVIIHYPLLPFALFLSGNIFFIILIIHLKDFDGERVSLTHKSPLSLYRI